MIAKDTIPSENNKSDPQFGIVEEKNDEKVSDNDNEGDFITEVKSIEKDADDSGIFKFHNKNQFPIVDTTPSTLSSNDLEKIVQKLWGFKFNEGLILPLYNPKIRNFFEKKITYEVIQKLLDLPVAPTQSQKKASKTILEWLKIYPELFHTLAEIKTPNYEIFKTENERKNFYEIYASQHDLERIRNDIIIMYNVQAGSYSLMPTMLDLLSYCTLAVPFGDYFDKDLQYRTLYLNLILSSGSCLSFICLGYSKEIRERVRYMKAHYAHLNELLKLCFEYELIKKVDNDFEIGEALETTKNIIYQVWNKTFEECNIQDFSQLKDYKTMDCTLNMYKALILSLTALKKLEMENEGPQSSLPSFHSNPELIDTIITEFSKILKNSLQVRNGFINVILCHLPGYTVFNNVPNISMFQVVATEAFTQHPLVKEEPISSLINSPQIIINQSSDLSSSDESSNEKTTTVNLDNDSKKENEVKINLSEIESVINKSDEKSAAALKAIASNLLIKGGFVKHEIFWRIRKVENEVITDKPDFNLTTIMQDVKDHIFYKTGSRSKFKLPYALVLLSGFIAGIPIFQTFEENNTLPSWLKFLIAAIAFVIVGTLKKLYDLIMSSYYKYNKEYERFENNLKDLIENNYFELVHKQASSVEHPKLQLINAPDNFNIYMNILSSSLANACQNKNIGFNDINDADKAFLTVRLFNTLAQLMRIEKSNSFKLSSEDITTLINAFTKKIEKSISLSFGDKLKKGRVTGAVSSGLSRESLLQCMVDALDKKLSPQDKLNILADKVEIKSPNDKAVTEQQNFVAPREATSDTKKMLQNSQRAKSQKVRFQTDDIYNALTSPSVKNSPGIVSSTALDNSDIIISSEDDSPPPVRYLTPLNLKVPEPKITKKPLTSKTTKTKITEKTPLTTPRKDDDDELDDSKISIAQPISLGYTEGMNL